MKTVKYGSRIKGRFYLILFIRLELDKILKSGNKATYIIDKRNLEDSQIYDESQGSRVGSTGLKSVPLAKIEMVVSTDELQEKDEILFKKKHDNAKK